MAQVSKIHIEDKYLMVASLDIGTSCSGYAFSYKSSRDTIKMNKNWQSTAGSQSYKTPTCILTNVGTQGDYVTFGYEAENTYIQSVINPESDKYDVYHNFKMNLHGVKKLNNSIKVKSEAGTVRPLMDIFVMMIKALIDHLMSAIKNEGVCTLNKDDVRWVITIPAIWPDNAKQFMKETAIKAGLKEENVLLSIEPEAASLHCRSLGINNFERATELYFETNTIEFTPGKKYMLIDAGGGTVDITAHEVLDEWNVRELHASTGGAWGGNKVNDNFIHLIKILMGMEFVERIQKECPQVWYNLMNKFENQKKLAGPKQKSLNIEVPQGISSKYWKWREADIEDDVKKSNMSGVSLSNGFLVLQQERASQLFTPVIQDITKYIDSMIKSNELKDETIDFLFLVGGFGDSVYLQDALQKYFLKSKIPVLVPEEAQIAVVQGAVRYGFNPCVFERKSKLTYGINTMLPYDEKKHKEEKKCQGDGGAYYCRDIFLPFIKKGDLVGKDAVGRNSVTPVNESCSSVILTFHTIDKYPDNDDVIYTDSEGVEEVGTITVDIPDTTGKGGQREAILEILFSDIYIQVKAIGIDQKTQATANINFMTY